MQDLVGNGVAALEDGAEIPQIVDDISAFDGRIEQENILTGFGHPRDVAACGAAAFPFIERRNGGKGPHGIASFQELFGGMTAGQIDLSQWLLNTHARKFLNQQVRGNEGLGLCGSEGAHLFHEERGSELVTFTLDVFRPSSIDRAPARAAFPTENNPIWFQIESTGRDRSDRGLVADPEWGVLPSSGAANGRMDPSITILTIWQRVGTSLVNTASH